MSTQDNPFLAAAEEPSASAEGDSFESQPDAAADAADIPSDGTITEQAAPPAKDNVHIFDRLPTRGQGFFGCTPKRSFYHTKRAADARQRAEVEVPEELAEARRVLVGAGLHRRHRAVPDEADHNAMTLAYAHRYAACDLNVIDSHAIHPHTGKGTFIDGSAKLPRGSAWDKRFTTNRDEINAFWTGDGRYPTKTGEVGRKYAKVHAVRNVSIAFPPGCGMFVLDIDGEEGKANLAKLEAEYGPLPKTAKSLTGSGGVHYIYRTSHPIRNTASAIASGIDIRGEGGQIIAAPSVHKSGCFYRWEDGSAPWDGIADGPEWLEELAVAASKKGKPNTKRKARAALRKAAGAGQNPFADQDRPKGFEEWLEAIGDHEGGRGFDDPIYVAAMSYFGQLGGEPDEGDFLDLKELLRERILEAECKDDRAETRYASDGYLARRIAQAWEYIEQSDADEEEEEDDPETCEAEASSGEATALPAKRDPLALAQKITRNSSEDDVRKLFKRLVKRGVDEMARGRVVDDIVARTPLGKRQLAKWWDAAVKERARAIAKEEGKTLILPSETGADEMVSKTIDALRTANEGSPVLFHHEVGLAKIEQDPHGAARIRNLESRDGLGHTINELGLFGKRAGHGDDTKIVPDFAPDDVVRHVWNTPMEKYSLPLHGLKATPYFDRHGGLVHENGYHPASKMVLAMPEGAALSRVSGDWVPTEDEVDDAVMMLAELFAVFPLDALTREDLLDRLDKGEETPSLCALLALVLLPFMREMIDGPTPGHFFTKPAPGTGASLLIETASMIALGDEVPSMSLPTNREEVDKTLTALFTSGMPIANFDNIDLSIDSGALASAMTKRRHAARLLGTPRTVEVPVRMIWVFSGNNVTMSGELLRRCVPIELDARLPDPTMGRTFLLDDIKAHVREHRWELVSAYLTLVQHWIAEGQPQYTGRALSSFEDWTRKMGGVLEAAGLRGFMANVEAWKENAKDGREEDAKRLMRALSCEEDGTIFRAKGTAVPRGVKGEPKVVSIIDLLNASNDAEEGVIRLDGAGYKEMRDDDSIRLVYSHPQHVTRVFGNLARVPHRFVTFADDDTETEVILKLEEGTDKKNGGTYWVKVPVGGGRDAASGG